MSRIGKMPIHLPKGVEVKISDDNVLTVKGPLGELSQKVNPMIEMKVEDGVLHFNRPNDERETKAQHGLYRALADNMVKVPAGWLIEKAGWKGWRDEHVGVYEKQALVLVHYGGGKGQDIVNLAQKIQNSVAEKFGIQICPEVNFVS